MRINFKFLNIIDKITLVAFYMLSAAVTFSTALTEICTWLIIGLWFCKKIQTKDFSLQAKPFSYILIAFLFWNALTFFNSAYINESIRGLLKVVQYTLLFFSASDYFDSKKSIKIFLYYSLGIAFFISLNGVYQYVSGIDLIRHRTVNAADYLHRISSSFAHPNDFGAYLIVMLTVLLSLFFSTQRRFKVRVLLFILTLILAWVTYATKSRGAWVSLTVSIVFLFSMKSKKLLVLFLLALLLSPFYMPQSVRHRFSDISDIRVSGTAWERAMLWQGAIKMIQARPLLGHGVNTYTKNFPDYKPADYPNAIYPHNSFLQMASETGIIGAGLFIAFFAAFITGMVRALKKIDKGPYRDLYLGLIAGITGFLCHCFVDTHLYSTVLAGFLFMYLGVAAAFRKVIYEQSS
jgi:putative inorganic carbon (hco3(-)) transporter